MHKRDTKKKQNSADVVEASRQGYLITTKQRFALNSADAVEINFYPERLEIRPHTPNNCTLF